MRIVGIPAIVAPFGGKVNHQRSSAIILHRNMIDID
jgi:hypothetical protein